MAIVEGTHYIYTVRPGDTLYVIARRFGSTVQLIEQTNALYPPITDPASSSRVSYWLYRKRDWDRDPLFYIL